MLDFLTNWKQWIPAAAIVLLLALGLLSEWILRPTCPLYDYTGLYCAGCGGTRGVSALLHGNLIECFRMNALLPLLALIAVLLCVKPRLIRYKVILIGIPVAILAFTVLRNLPAFTYLAPL